MRTNIEIDDKLMRQAMAATKATTKKAAVEASMRLAVRLKAQEGIKELFGKVVWRGPGDDWLASDEEVTRKHRRSERKAVSNEVPATGKKLASASGRR
jgi:hypothetical protein